MSPPNILELVSLCTPTVILWTGSVRCTKGDEVQVRGDGFPHMDY